MLAQVLLSTQNQSHLLSFFASIRAILSQPNGAELFETERTRFEQTYGWDVAVFEQARECRRAVKQERGKGSMGIKKEKEALMEVCKE